MLTVYFGPESTHFRNILGVTDREVVTTGSRWGHHLRANVRKRCTYSHAAYDAQLLMPWPIEYPVDKATPSGPA